MNPQTCLLIFIGVVLFIIFYENKKENYAPALELIQSKENQCENDFELCVKECESSGGYLAHDCENSCVGENIACRGNVIYERSDASEYNNHLASMESAYSSPQTRTTRKPGMWSDRGYGPKTNKQVERVYTLLEQL